MPLDLKPWMEQLTIQKKDLRTEPLRLDEPFAWAQKALVAEIERQYNLGLPVRIIVLKGRQLGVSTATEGVLFNWTFLHPGTNSLVIAHETRASQHLFDMTKLMWDEWPLRPLYTEKHNSQKSLAWQETRSSMSVATARNAGSGRSFTYHAVHCSECAFWEDPERLLVGLNQSVPYKPGTIIIYESTANGVGGWFHEEWKRAVAGESTVVPLFFPWYRHQEYAFYDTTLKQTDLIKEERELQVQYKLSLPQLAWRRHTISNDCLNDEDQFKQEYPNSPDEAFLSTGRNVFPLLKLHECYDPQPGKVGFLTNNNGKLEFVPDPTGPLRIFKWPADHSQWGQYVVAGDPSKTTFGDYACIQVINRRTFEQVAIYRRREDPVPFAHEIMKLGYFFNQALVNVEVNGAGYGSIAIILEHSYPNIWKHRWADKDPGKLSQSWGWEMSYKRKQWASGHTINVIAQNALTIHDADTYEEMRDYVVLPNGEFGPASERGYDDTVTSMMIAICSTLTEPQLPFEEPQLPQPIDIGGKPMWEAFD